MILPGRYNTLKVVKFVDFGVYLDGAEMGRFFFLHVMFLKNVK